MNAVLFGFLPIWVITGLGWVAARHDILGGQAQHVLGRFAFTFAMPALLFLAMAGADVTALLNVGVLVFALSLLVVFAAGLLVSRWVYRRGQAEQAIGAMAAGYVNSANLGIPVAVHVLGDTSFVITVALFQMLFVAPVVLVLIDLDVRRDRRGRAARMLQLPFRNPIIAASLAGVAVSALGWDLPAEATAPSNSSATPPSRPPSSRSACPSTPVSGRTHRGAPNAVFSSPSRSWPSRCSPTRSATGCSG